MLWYISLNVDNKITATSLTTWCKCPIFPNNEKHFGASWPITAWIVEAAPDARWTLSLEWWGLANLQTRSKRWCPRVRSSVRVVLSYPDSYGTGWRNHELLPVLLLPLAWLPLWAYEPLHNGLISVWTSASVFKIRDFFFGILWSRKYLFR